MSPTTTAKPYAPTATPRRRKKKADEVGMGKECRSRISGFESHIGNKGKPLPPVIEVYGPALSDQQVKTIRKRGRQLADEMDAAMEQHKTQAENKGGKNV